MKYGTLVPGWLDWHIDPPLVWSTKKIIASRPAAIKLSCPCMGRY